VDLESLLLSLPPYRLGSLSHTSRGWEVLLWSGPIGYSTYAVGSHPSSPYSALTSALLNLRDNPLTLECNEPKASYSSLSALFAKPSVPLDFKKRI
jgi:hypothetical protein